MRKKSGAKNTRNSVASMIREAIEYELPVVIVDASGNIHVLDFEEIGSVSFLNENFVSIDGLIINMALVQMVCLMDGENCFLPFDSLKKRMLDLQEEE